MRRFFVAIVLPFIFLAGASAADDGWPKTKAGIAARGWVEAFANGEDAMRKFYAENMAEATLRQRSMDERLALYRTNHLRFGTLRFVSVNRSQAAELEVVLAAEDGSQHKFIFNVQPEDPNKLVSVKMIDVVNDPNGHSHPH